MLVVGWIGWAGGLGAETDRCPMPTADSEGPIDLCPKVYRITCKPGNRISSGYDAQVDGSPGIITALHGVVGCNQISAWNLTRQFFNLDVEKINLRKDLAFLTSSAVKAAARPAIRVDSGFIGRQLQVVGYAQGLGSQWNQPLTPQPDPTKLLRNILPPQVLLEFEKRQSPHPDETVLALTGALQHGYSGAPILTEDGTVVAVADGGLGGGAFEIGWAIPIQNVQWDPPQAHATQLAALAEDDSGKLFGISPAPIPQLPDLYFTDGRESRGRIYRFANDRLSQYYVRPQGQLHYIAVSQNGTIYFSNANDKDLYRLESGTEKRVYTHKTYLRDIAFDYLGRLYFSESSGAGSDGYIYRLEGDRASFYYRVRLDQVDGYWSGNFAFDKDGYLWLSSGNHRPAHLYKVVESRPQRMFTSAQSIRGLSFIADNILIYANFRQSIRRLDLTGYLSSKIKSFGMIHWLNDVEPARRLIINKPLVLSPYTKVKPLKKLRLKRN
jgi:hypothetical protein